MLINNTTLKFDFLNLKNIAGALVKLSLVMLFISTSANRLAFIMENYLHYQVNQPERFGPFLERWKQIELFEGFYNISDYGRCISLQRTIINKHGQARKLNQKMLKPYLAHNGYMRYTFSINHIFSERLTHILIAKHFIPNPQNKPEVNHKNGIKSDTFIGNLEWVTPSENHIHAYQIGLQTSYQERLILDISTGIYFDSIKQAAIAYGIDRKLLNERLIKGRDTKNLILA